MSATLHPAGFHRHAMPDLHRAWWSFALYPVAIVAAFIVGEGIPAWLGYDVAVTEAPWWVMALALVGAVLVVALPLLVTGHYARRADRHGEVGAMVPLAVGTVLLGGFVLVNLVSGVAILLLE